MPPIATSSPSAAIPPFESPSLASMISKLHLQPHPEGGYYSETDRSPFRVPNPFFEADAVADEEKDDNKTRSASTTIFYLLTPHSPRGVFHRNKARTMHTLHKGRGQYIIIHPPSSVSRSSSPSSSLSSNPNSAAAKDPDGYVTARVETFYVGHDVKAGERLQWMVEGDVYKASFLLPSSSTSPSSSLITPLTLSAPANKHSNPEMEEDMLLISETVVPGFEFRDHNFLTWEGFEELVSDEKMREELGWLVRRMNGERENGVA